jgi:hypothetical protein
VEADSTAAEENRPAALEFDRRREDEDQRACEDEK